MKNSRLPSFYLIPTVIVSLCVLVLILAALFVSVSQGEFLGKTAQKKPFEDYGLELPDDFKRDYRYKSPSDGFHGDGVTVTKYNIGGETDFFNEIKAKGNSEIEAQLGSAMESAGVPKELYPDLSGEYTWKKYSYDFSHSLLIIYLKEQETAIFVETII